MIFNLVRRNIRLYFRDKATVFFSMLGVFVIIGLYIIFLGNMVAGSGSIAGASSRFFTDSWIMAGVIATSTITTTLGSLGQMVDDLTKKINRDFETSPIIRWKIVLSYAISSIVIGIMMSVITFILAEIYIVLFGGSIVSFGALLKILGLIILSTITASSFLFFFVSMVKTMNAFSVISTIVGTLIGFLMGIYVPIGELPTAIQTFIKIFPPSHAALLLRQVMMNEVVQIDYVPRDVSELLGVRFFFGDFEFTPLISILILVGTMLIFFGLSVIVATKRKREA
jgi:multidrug/hemolysin transport system permease protein